MQSDGRIVKRLVAAFGMVLRNSEHRGSATLEQAIRLARGALVDEPEGYRADFVRLARRAPRLHGEWTTEQGR